jgi:hypothetical protein
MPYKPAKRSRALSRFIRDNRDTIDGYILNKVPNLRRLNDDERREWILNDEGLYRDARAWGWRG